MAIDRGALLAQTYQLPQAQPQAPIQEQPFQDEIGDPAAGLQQIDGVTDEYFQKWAALKGFARDVQENLGVDVRFPDPSIPGSERLHRIYLKSLADLKAQGERLKTGQQMFMADRQRGAVVSGDPRQQYYDQLNVGTDIVDAELDPIVKAANDKLQGPHFGSSIKEAEEYRARVLQMLEQRRDTDKQNSGYWQRQIDSLIEPVQAVREFNPYSYNRGYTRLQQGQINAAGTFLKKMTNLQKGTADSYELSDSIFGPNGERVYVSTDTKDETFGGKKILRYEHIPDTDQTFLLLQDREGKTHRMDVTNVDPMSHAKGYMDNVRYASHGQYLDIWADENNYLDPETGEVNYEPLLAKDADKRKESRKKEYSDVKRKDEEAKAQAVSKTLDEMKFGFWGDDDIDFIAADGREIQVEREKGGFRVLNIKQLIPGQKSDFYNSYKNMSKESIEKFLLQHKVHLSDPSFKDLRAQTGTNTAPTSTSGTDW